MPKKLVTPKTFEEIANAIHTNDSITTGIGENGFVLQHTFNTQNCTFVGLHEQDSEYVVGKMWKKSEVTGRNDPKLKTSENKYVQCDLYRLDISDLDDSDDTVEQIAEKIDGKSYDEKIDTGYINGHRLTPLHRVLEDVFKWYSH